MPRQTVHQKLTARILALRGVDAGRSRYGDEMAFFVGGREIAHFQSATVIDIRLTRALIAKLVKNDPRVIPRPSSSDWVELAFKNEADIADMVRLVERAADANRRS